MNLWGHDRRAPRLELRDGVVSGSMHGDILDWMARAKGLYVTPRKFPELARLLVADPKADTRQRRSERREAHALFAAAAIYRTDLGSARVGVVQEDGRQTGLPVRQIASWGDLNRRRFERAIADFMAAGYQRSVRDKAGRQCAAVTDEKGRHRPGQPRIKVIDEETGKASYEALAAIREWTPLFWERLGVAAEALAHRRKAAADRKAAAEKLAEDQEDARRSKAEAAKSAAARLAKIKSAPRDPPSSSADNMRAMARAQQMMQADPGLSLADAMARARREITADATGPPRPPLPSRG